MADALSRAPSGNQSPSSQDREYALRIEYEDAKNRMWCRVSDELLRRVAESVDADPEGSLLKRPNKRLLASTSRAVVVLSPSFVMSK